jgi:flagellin FlaB
MGILSGEHIGHELKWIYSASQLVKQEGNPMRELLHRPKESIPWIRRNQRGVTGLETAIVLIAFVVVSSVFAFAALSTGLFSADKSKETIRAGLSEARGTLELRGSVIGNAGTTGSSGTLSTITFQVSNAAGGEAIDLTPGETIIKYQDTSQSRTFIDSGDYAFTISGLGNADSDNLVEPGELYEISINNLLNLTGDLSVDTRFTVQVITPKGAVMNIERTTPVWMETFNDLG